VFADGPFRSSTRAFCHGIAHEVSACMWAKAIVKLLINLVAFCSIVCSILLKHDARILFINDCLLVISMCDESIRKSHVNFHFDV